MTWLKCILLLLIFLPITALSQSDSVTSKQTFLNTTIDPDSYSIVCSKIGGKWNNKVGGEYAVDILKEIKFISRYPLEG